MTTSSLIMIMIAIAVYLLVMIFIGASFMKKNNNSEDYFLGGRSLNGFVAALSAGASDMSGWMLMGLPGSIYLLGTGQVWIGIGLMLGTIANWLFIAGPLRKYTIKANNSLTLPEFFVNRYRDDKKILLGISSVVIVIFFVVYTASAFASGGKLFNSVFGMDYHLALIIGALVILTYTFMGGFLAVCTTDFIQGLLMLIAVMFVPAIALINMGGGNFSANLVSTGVDPASFLNPMQENGTTISAVSILSSLAWGLGYFGMPHILVRFMAIKDKNELKKSKSIAILWVVLGLGFACFIGLLGRAYLAAKLGVMEDSEKVFIEMIKKVFTEDSNLALLAGLFIAAILAAIMSTADSQLLVASSAVSEDLYKGIVKKDASESSVLNVGRTATIVVAIIALFIAWNPDSSVMKLVSDAWAGFGAAFGPLVICSLFWRRTNFAGAFAGILTGALTVIVWDYIPLVGGKTIGTVTGLYSLLPGFIISLAAIIIVSLCTPAPSEEIMKEFDEVKAEG
ncbi:MAG: sodium/proline symporter PutP [Lachnospiraceae bacterium]|nr:sodium/proline symporter PutP [Lachnospiraceae bacterium]